MKIQIGFVSVLGVILLSLNASGFKDKTMKQTLALAMPEGDGSNGAGVAYNPLKKMYYAVFAGNETYPIAVFNNKGKIVKTGIYTGFDVRGFWYNAKTNAVEGNAYGVTGGYWSKKIESNGFPESKTTPIFETDEYEEMEYQPDNNSVGVCNVLTNEIYFLMDGKIATFNRENGESKSTAEIKNLPCMVENLNAYGIAYTGIPKMEFAVLNYVDKKIYLINAIGFSVSKTVNLPAKAIVYDRFNFSYCNGIYWLFDKDSRKWIGYK